jgi:tripartite ATP-independent transporter DctM subunit
MVPTILSLSLVIILTVGPVLGAAVGLAGIILLEFAAGGATQLAITAVWNALTDFTLSAVPVFIILGEILLRSGLSERVYGGLSPLFTHVPGRLLHTNIAVASVFAAVSGSSTSTAAAVGTVGFAELERRKYDLPTVVGSLAAGGTLGLLIPPSLSLIIYGATQNVSIGKLFIAGILPGVLMAFAFMVYLAVLSIMNRDLVPTDEPKANISSIIRGLISIWPLVILIFSVLGTIYLGIATPTESAALGVATAIILGFAVGNLTLTKLWQAFGHATAVFAAVALMFVGTLILSQAISILAIPTHIVEAIGAYGLSKYMTFFLICVVYLVLGCFFDGISLLLMTLPVVFPLMMHLGFDPIWFGIIVTILVEIGMITPPIGMNLYVLVAISGQRVTLAQAAIAACPYWLAMLMAIIVFTIFPSIILFLPNLY